MHLDAVIPRTEMPNAVRGVAAMVVAAGHAWQVLLYPLDPDSIIFRVMGGLATWAVAAFFALSGMLIAFSIRKRVASGHFRVGVFLADRCKRIFPPLIFAVAMTLAVALSIQGFDLQGAETFRMPGDLAIARENADFDWRSVIPTITLFYNFVPGVPFLMLNGPLWSLSYEFWYYVLAGLAGAGLLNRSKPFLTVALILLFWMLFGTKAVPSFWAVGAVWWSGFLVGWNWRIVCSLPNWMFWTGAAVTVTAAVLVAGSDLTTFLTQSYGTFRKHLFYVLVGFAICLAITWLMRSQIKPYRWAVSAGDFSYTLYLVHFPFLLLSASLFRQYSISYGFSGHLFLAAVSWLTVIVFARKIAGIVENRQSFWGIANMSGRLRA